MIKDVLGKFNKVKTEVKMNYLNYSKLPVDEKLVLLEGGQGTNINGNMFSMLKELNTNPRWKDYKTVFVVTDNTLEKAESRMKFYGFDRVILSVRGNDDYCRYLATAKYLMTDNSFPPFFSKRKEQVFLNTWHGTPLKTLGKSDKSNLASLANIQKNYLMSDYALFPNEFTRKVFMEDYDLKHIFKGNSLIANYPRNYIFYDKNQSDEMKKKLGYGGKTVFAYMPTWRGTGRTADTANQLESTMHILKEFDEKLDDDTVLLVNLHFLLAKDIDCSAFKHIDYFSSDYDTYEILNACDGLVTDYSSVFFDFAVTGKKIILFAYDKEDYLGSRGIYMPFDTLPFPIVQTVDEVIGEFKTPAEVDEKFIAEYCSNGSIDSCEKLFDMMVSGKSEFYNLEKHGCENKKLCLIFAGLMHERLFEDIKTYTKQNNEYNYVIVYRKNLNKAKKEFILSLNSNVSTLGTITAFQLNYKELISVMLKRIFKKTRDNKTLDAFYEREKDRLFYSIKPDKIVDFSCGNQNISGMLARMTGTKEYVKRNYLGDIRRNDAIVACVEKYEEKKGFKAVDINGCEISDENSVTDYKNRPLLKNIAPLYLTSQNRIKNKFKLVCLSSFVMQSHIETKLSETYVTVGDRVYKPHFIANKNKLSKKHRGIYYFSVPVEDVIDMPATNKVCLVYKDENGEEFECSVIYTSMTLGRFLGLRGPFCTEKNTNTVAIFRQSKKNLLTVYVRSKNVSDALSKRIMQIFAFALALLWHSEKAKKLVLLYEKNSAKYEESASALFEKLLDSGYKYSYFIVTKEHINEIPEKYRKNVLIKHSFKHYLYFFKSKTFIGTETLVHAIDLKTFNKLALMKVADKNKNYVFLQHGVMYMVSLDSEARTMFKRKELVGKYRVVVSSQAEADHFVELGNHFPEDLYITGLPKFDKNTLNDDADKIIIMPTWRPWEINTARDDFLETSYFKMIMKIFDSVPENLKDKVIILPHPLIINELKNLPDSVSNTIITDAKYDDILKQARILITDYSSIAYDAFYRGSRVIFYWEEKDDCMAHYGPTTKLMLNENNVYGDYFYSEAGLSDAIEYNYNNPQSEKYKERYAQIVTYHDGCNTQRLIDFLKDDNII